MPGIARPANGCGLSLPGGASAFCGTKYSSISGAWPPQIGPQSCSTTHALFHARCQGERKCPGGRCAILIWRNRTGTAKIGTQNTLIRPLSGHYMYLATDSETRWLQHTAKTHPPCRDISAFCPPSSSSSRYRWPQKPRQSLAKTRSQKSLGYLRSKQAPRASGLAADHRVWMCKCRTCRYIHYKAQIFVSLT